MMERSESHDARRARRNGGRRLPAAHRRTTASRAGALAVALAVLAVLAAACGAGSGGDSAAVEKLLNRQLALAKAGTWEGLYETYSPRYRSRCPYESLLKRASDADPGLLQSLSYEQLHVQIDGDTAYLTYVTARNGQVVSAVTDASPDIYVNIDGAWFDEYDELAVCS